VVAGTFAPSADAPNLLVAIHRTTITKESNLTVE
jgi:hypothetical protein